MKLFKITFCILFCGLIAALPASAQNFRQLRETILQQQAETRSEIEEIDALINRYQRRLNEAEREYEKIFEQYENLQKLLALQKQKLRSLQQEQQQINAEIAVTERKLEQQQERLEQLIEDYKETMRYLYKHGRTSQMALILSSESVNQMMVRNYYLKEFEDYREQQAADIRQTQEDLKQSQVQLDSAAVRNDELLAEIEAEKESLEKRTQQQQANVKLLRQDKEKYERMLAEERKNRQEFQETLAQLEEDLREAEEMRRRQEAEQAAENVASAGDASASEMEADAAAEATGSANVNYSGEAGFFSDAEMASIEDSFSSLKGDLPWPVESSTIAEHFGQRRHPVYGTVTENLGIEIVTQPREEVRVVHDGFVFAVQPLAGFGDVVFVKHGKFITAYGNLSRVTVRKDTILEQGDLVGYSGDQNSALGESVFFMLRSGSQNVDPESWIKNK